MARRVLVLTYYFPPSGGPGVQRVLKFVKYFPTFDWTPTVVTVREGAYPERDASLERDVPSDVAIERTSSWDPYTLYARFTGRSDEDAVVQGSVEGRKADWKERLARWIRANVFLPDARVGWVPFAVWRGRQLLSRESFDAILTTGPPHSVHLAGATLQWLTGTPWIADFRDPWTDINYYHELPHTDWAARLDAGLERMVTRRARAVTTVSPTWREALQEKSGRTDADAFTVVQNGFDEEDIPPPSSVSDDEFDVTHVGSLYASRNPDAFWRAIHRLREKGRVPRLRIRLVGSVDPNVWRSLQAYDLISDTDHVPYVPHREAVTYMGQAGLLLLSIEAFSQAEGMMTGKIYEYLASGRPVVGVGPPEGDAARLLEKVGGGTMFGREDVSGLSTFIEAHYRAWDEGSPVQGAPSDALSPYRRRVQTERMAHVLEEACR